MLVAGGVCDVFVGRRLFRAVGRRLFRAPSSNYILGAFLEKSLGQLSAYLSSSRLRPNRKSQTGGGCCCALTEVNTAGPTGGVTLSCETKREKKIV